MSSDNTLVIVPTPGVVTAGAMVFPPSLSECFDRAAIPAHVKTGECAVKIGEIRDMRAFSDYQSMVIKETEFCKHAGEDEMFLTLRERKFAEALQVIVDFEAAHSAVYKDKTAYFTCRQNMMKAGFRQPAGLKDAWHTDRGDFPSRLDGFPLLDHIYVVSDREGTLIQERSMPQAMKNLRGIEGPVPGKCFQAEPYAIYLMTNYCYHAAPVIRRDGPRTFMRVTFSSAENSVLQARPLHERLKMGLKI